VAMEATGIYWKPIWHMLEGRFELVLTRSTPRRRLGFSRFECSPKGETEFPFLILLAIIIVLGSSQ
jgi:hypothetical protein